MTNGSVPVMDQGLYIYRPICTKNRADEPTIPAWVSYRTAYENHEVTVISSRGYPFDQGFRTCQGIRSSQKRPMRQLSRHLCRFRGQDCIHLRRFCGRCQAPWIFCAKWHVASVYRRSARNHL